MKYTLSLFRPTDEIDRNTANVHVRRFHALDISIDTPKWTAPRILCELVYMATNKPNMKSEVEMDILEQFRLANQESIMVGDLIQVDEDYYLCNHVTWTLLYDYKP